MNTFRKKKEERRKLAFSCFPTFLIVAFLSVVFSTATYAQNQELLYENESDCEYKVEIWTGNCSPCTTTVGPIPASSNGTLYYTLPCGQSICGIRFHEVGGNFSVPTSNEHDCGLEEEIYGPFDCMDDFDFAIYGCAQVKIYATP